MTDTLVILVTLLACFAFFGVTAAAEYVRRFLAFRRRLPRSNDPLAEDVFPEVAGLISATAQLLNGGRS